MEKDTRSEAMTGITLEEQEMLALLIDTSAKLALSVERRLPLQLRAEQNMLRRHSPHGWRPLYWKRHAELGAADREILLLRATLATICDELHMVAHAVVDIEQETPPTICNSHNL